MIARLIAWSLRRRGLVALTALGLLLAGALHLRSMPVDAIPDLSDVQVIVYTDFPGQAPQVVEDQVTYPLVTALLGVSNVKVVRGQSMFSTSFVYVIFTEGTDLYWARSRVLEYLGAAQTKLPATAKTQLGPDATGVGWVYQYAVEGAGYSPAQLRSIQDFQIRYALRGVPGVAEVASIGGFVKQYQVLLDPVRLQAFGVSAPEVIAAVRGANQDVGARTVEVAGSDYAIRGLGYFRGVADIAAVAIGMGSGGRPVRVEDVADVTLGSDLRLGIAERNGRGEAVGGVIVMRAGANALDVVKRVKARLAELAPTLPAGVTIATTYDRTDLIHRSIKTLERTLLEESVIVALVCLLFLLHARSALVAIVTLPLGILASLTLVRHLGINANIMSLGGIAIAIGAMIDAAIVLIENLHKHIEHEPDRPHWERVLAASREVGPALFMSLLIITLSFLPVFTLEDQEGRLFRPLALTKTFAMAAAALLSVTLVPVLMGFFVKGRVRPETANPLNRWARAAYRPVLRWALAHRLPVLGGALLLLALSLLPLLRLGSEFMPPLAEGSLMYMPNTLPSVSLTQQRRLLHVEDSILMTYPEVASVWGKAGRANTATDWAPISMVETVVNLKPKQQWRPGLTQERIIAELDRKLRFTGVLNTWTMPIKNRTDMLSTGIRTTLGIRIYGPDLQEIQRIGSEIERALAPVRGTASIYAERSFGGRYLDIRPDAAALARYGLTTRDVQEVVALALGGEEVTTTVEGRERYPVQVRYARDFRDSPEAIGRVLVGQPGGVQIPLAQVAEIRFAPGAAMIRSENGSLNDLVSIEVRGRDVGGYVAEAKRVVAERVSLPAGYRLEWSGQYEALQRVKARLSAVVPLTLALIALLLYLTFGSVTQMAIVLLSLPFALIGGVWAMWLLHFNLSIAVAVGFIALAGVAAETGVVMLLYLDHAWADISRGGRVPTLGELVQAIEYGAVNRLRPKLMTVLAIMLGLLPALWSHGTGAEVMQRIAAPMVGGMISSTILTLLVIPVMYFLWRRRGLEREPAPMPPSRSFAAALAAGMLFLPVRSGSAQAGHHGMPGMAGMSQDTMATMAPLGIPHSRMGSGTSWVPDASAMRHYHYQRRARGWMFMGHGVLDVYYDHQGTPRGDTQLGSTNWLMAMAMGRLGGGMLQFDAMLSAEPFTVGGRGYPLLLQSGESYQGQALHDRQHPHDLFMELSASYEHALGRSVAVSFYAAPVGEPALGPVAFMHRPSAQSDPFASIAHHWQDVTHISFGVATLGVYSRTVKLEGSVFNGREPDEARYDFDFRKLDSWSARLLVNPGEQWSLNASYGFLKSPEGLHAAESLRRVGASLMHTARVGSAGELASALVYGANKRRTPGVPSQPLEQSIVAESNLQLDGRNVMYGRMTWVEKSAEELVLPGFPPEQHFGLTTVSLGYAHELLNFSQTALELGLRGEVGFIPAALQPTYGTRHPAGIAVYLRLRPMAPQSEPQMKM